MFALLRLAFAAAPSRKRLNLATPINSSAHSSIGTPSPRQAGALTACRHTVSGSISLPSRGSFHLSLTVLVRYRSSRVFSLGMWSPQLPTGFLVSRGTQGQWQEPHPFAYRAITLCGWPFQAHSARDRLVTPCPFSGRDSHALQPRNYIGPEAVKQLRFGLFPVRSPLLRE